MSVITPLFVRYCSAIRPLLRYLITWLLEKGSKLIPPVESKVGPESNGRVLFLKSYPDYATRFGFVIYKFYINHTTLENDLKSVSSRDSLTFWLFGFR